MRVGYARVRPDPLDAHWQQAILSRYAIEQFHLDLSRTGASQLSIGLDAAVAELGQELFLLAQKDIALRDGPAVFDLRAADQLLVSVISVAADFDADLAAQRATKGWRTARNSGHLPGRKPALSPQQEAEIRALSKSGVAAERLATQFSIGRSTIYGIVGK